MISPDKTLSTFYAEKLFNHLVTQHAQVFKTMVVTVHLYMYMQYVLQGFQVLPFVSKVTLYKFYQGKTKCTM